MYSDDDSPAARGTRLKRARQMAGLSTGELASKTGFSRASISYWENAAYNGLSHKGAEKIARILTEEYDIKCDVGWLLLGIGDMPTWNINKNNSALKTESALDKKSANSDKRLKEIELFTKTYKKSVVVQIKHNLMMPLYETGDWVGGCWVSLSTKLVGQSCIVHQGNSFEVRILRAGSQFNKFNLCFMTYSELASQPFELRDISLIEAAPIIRVWK